MKGYLCPICFHGSAEPFRCGGPHHGKYDFVDAVAVVEEAEADRLKAALKEEQTISAAVNLALEHVICDSPGTPNTVKGYLRELVNREGRFAALAPADRKERNA